MAMKTYSKTIFLACIVVILFFGSIESILRIFNIGNFILEEFTAIRPLNSPLLIKDRYAGVKIAPNAIYGNKFLKIDPTLLGPKFLKSNTNQKAEFVRMNSLGFRDQELKKDATYKVLCLGDSTTFGWGLYSNDLIFTKKMLLRSIKDVVIHIADNE